MNRDRLLARLRKAEEANNIRDEKRDIRTNITEMQIVQARVMCTPVIKGTLEPEVGLQV